MVETIVEGRRERKKRQTRQAISDAATRLFFQHGFEAVSLAQVAEAADVSVKTIFNHFGSKEDLFFDRTGELQASLVRALLDRPSGTAPLCALRSLLVDNWIPFAHAAWEELSPEAFAGHLQFLAAQEHSPALRARRLVIERDLGSALVGPVAMALDLPADDATVAVLTTFVAAALQLRSREFATAALAGSDPAGVRRRVTAVVDEAFRRLGTAYPDLT
jgi:AcrR family transcriptional regulator